MNIPPADPARAGTPTKAEKKLMDSVAGSTAMHMFTLQLLKRINDDCGTKFTNLDYALTYLVHAHEVHVDLQTDRKELAEENSRLSQIVWKLKDELVPLRRELEEGKAVLAELESMIDLPAINHSGLQQTLVLWKRMSREERMHYERISHDCPVEEHPEIFIDTHGYIRLTNGRFA